MPVALRATPYACPIEQSVGAAGSAEDAVTAASAVCRSCGAVPREGARFCDTCGSQLVAAVDAAEYKQVTVLFADVVHSMDIAAALDMERLRDIMTELIERSAVVVRRYGGTVEYIGDGVMAIFGAPVALEDHAFRACLAGLAIQEEVNRLAAQVQSSDGVALRLRVGLNSGRVIAGEIGSGALGYAATGETVGLAQRMESVAPPGGVMLSESTTRLVEHLAVLAEPESVRIKGVAEPDGEVALSQFVPAHECEAPFLEAIAQVVPLAQVAGRAELGSVVARVGDCREHSLRPGDVG